MLRWFGHPSRPGVPLRGDGAWFAARDPRATHIADAINAQRSGQRAQRGQVLGDRRR